MDGRVMAHYGGDLGQVNVQATARQKLMRVWG
jgi:hypothetical protein